ncbi:UDP-N-acetylmuramate dehydrogenase [Peptoanaerobacter stomatis]|uniref:UDP-N-acetylenolpyruvoylglucosamine reductase n=1 Tax=Peptoanaerobacter stomatis TaxID=796937 RepID=G9WZR9_9FIRM|nr:UDP-N-acetylmuramate dehydrogenase [Peptoanaerobacter stomatis]EHL15699.1 UDP-N-acetylenolpyruvoylglucosamine reductase [Peptoanaerobacter stomatis]EHL19395.1 UDP-N-acetylenolpyruvoylglucosamine reductase [Peptoanaerobacter stomatis]
MISKRENIDVKSFIAEKLAPYDLITDYPMKNCTSFHIGGEADFFVRPKSLVHLMNILEISKSYEYPVFVMGNGSNLLVSDKGIRAIVVQLSDNFSQLTKIDDETVEVESGMSMTSLSKYFLDNSLTGFEFACGIPGTIGGAVTMNAGAYDSMMSNVVQEVIVLDKDMNIKKLSNEQMQFSYRNSIISKKNLVVLSIRIKLKKGNFTEIKEKIDDYTFKRTSKQPLSYYSAGSTFKRPEGYFAGKLIEDSGLKGLVMKNVAVSSMHSGFVINLGNATCSEVLEMLTFIKQVVGNKFHVSLEEEIKIVGEF